MHHPKQHQLHHGEPHRADHGAKLNWLRASVLGANDGIVSVASIVVGVAGASNSISFILTAGVAGLVAGALSMAVGEYISVSAQRDTEKALIEKERRELEEEPELELQELIQIYKRKGLTLETAQTVAHELTHHDAFKAHLDAELNIDPHNLVSPWQAAAASAVAFFLGALIPLIMITVAPAAQRIPVTFLGVLVALVVTGTLSGQASGASKAKTIVRVVVGGALAMAITFAIGRLFGLAGI